MSRIESARAWGCGDQGRFIGCAHTDGDRDVNNSIRVRILRERDYRRLMAVVRAARYVVGESRCTIQHDILHNALDALDRKGRKP